MHKNPRVKQFVIEHTIVPFMHSIATEKDLVGNIFRAIKDKLVQMVLKDTSATCRDAAVTLLVTFRQLIPDNPLVEQAAVALPKYRISEIQKRVDGPAAQEAAQTTTEAPTSSQTMAAKSPKEPLAVEPTEEAAENDKPKFAKSLTDKIKQSKQQASNQNNSNAQ